jgi:hypothetical protein
MLIAPEEFEFETRKLTIDDLREEVAYESKFQSCVFGAYMFANLFSIFYSAYVFDTHISPVNYYNQPAPPPREFAEEAESAEYALDELGADDQAAGLGDEKDAEEVDALEEDVHVEKHEQRLLQPLPFSDDGAPDRAKPSHGEANPAAAFATRRKAATAEEPWEARTPVPAPSIPLQQSDPALAEARMSSGTSSDAAAPHAALDRAHPREKASTAPAHPRGGQSLLEDSAHSRQLAEEVEALLLRDSGDNDNPWDQVFRDVSDRPREDESGDAAMCDLEAGHPSGSASSLYRGSSSRVPSESVMHRRAGSKSSAGSSTGSVMQMQRTMHGSVGSAGTGARARAYEVDEEAALVSSYFTCFCEQEEGKQGVGNGGARRAGGGATAEEEESKVAYEAGEGDEEVAARGWRPRRRGGEGCAGTQRGGRRVWDQVTSSCAIM